MATLTQQPDTLRRHELAGFLRSRRERIVPEQVGLSPGGRRRTPGLRREEVAQLAGVGVTWYTWLEQGRDIRASEQVLDAIARTLRLDPFERAHLFTLAGAPEPAVEKECRAISPGTHTILRQLEPLPAAIQNARCDFLAVNRTFDRMVGGLTHRPIEERNGLLLAFTDADWRSRLADWPESGMRLVGQFRAAMAQHVAEPGWKCLVKRLKAESPEFVAMWEQHEVKALENLTKRYLSPEVGLMRFHYTNMWFGPHPGLRMTVYTPVDEDSWEKVRTLRSLAV
jgi:transcriptional regulator with XRE-family HTH domain